MTRKSINHLQEILAVKYGCNTSIFNDTCNHIIKSDKSFFELMSFGTNAVIWADKSIYSWCMDNLYTIEHKRLTDGKMLFEIESMLRKHGKRLDGEQLRFLILKDIDLNRPDGFTYKLFEKDEIGQLKDFQGFGNAVNHDGDDVIAYGAYDGERLVALAGADDKLGQQLWQVGIDTLPDYRKKGLAAYLVRALSDEINNRGVLPFYTTWSANLGSLNVAIKAGYRPVWHRYIAVDE